MFKDRHCKLLTDEINFIDIPSRFSSYWPSVTIPSFFRLVQSCKHVTWLSRKKNVICLPTKHLGVLKTSFESVRALQIYLEFGSVGF